MGVCARHQGPINPPYKTALDAKRQDSGMAPLPGPGSGALMPIADRKPDFMKALEVMHRNVSGLSLEDK